MLYEHASFALFVVVVVANGGSCVFVFVCSSCTQLAVQLRRDVKPLLDEMGVGLKFVSIGTTEKAELFAKETEFPMENLYADLENECYDALGFYKGLGRTFFNKETPASIKKRTDEGKDEDLKKILPKYKPLLPPKLSQGLQQGGLYVFAGEKTVFEYKDPGKLVIVMHIPPRC